MLADQKRSTARKVLQASQIHGVLLRGNAREKASASRPSCLIDTRRIHERFCCLLENSYSGERSFGEHSSTRAPYRPSSMFPNMSLYTWHRSHGKRGLDQNHRRYISRMVFLEEFAKRHQQLMTIYLHVVNPPFGVRPQASEGDQGGGT